MIERVKTTVSFISGELSGEHIIESKKTLGDLKGVFKNEACRASMDQDTLVYRVQMHDAENEGTGGGLFFGTSFISPGSVDKEYFMTRGHFHSRVDRAEYYWCIQGEGALILMDQGGRCRLEKMSPGSLHYIPGRIAHRIANTGDTILAVGACWPSDAGHDYQTIAEQGFGVRLKGINGVPVLIENEGL